jgi:amino-acid N-acetyltransferase
MLTEMIIENATAADRPEIIRLLADADLPTQDLPAELTNFLIVRENHRIVGSVGLEMLASYALLRSLAVESTQRGKGLGIHLYEAAMREAARRRVEAVYLITNTAEIFFARQGFSPANREVVPDAIRNTAQFRGVCPGSAVVMVNSVLSKSGPLPGHAADFLA